MAAEKKLPCMCYTRMPAANIGVAACNPMDKSILHEKLNGAINSHRRDTRIRTIIHHVKNIVCAYRFMTCPNQFQDTFT